MRLTASAKASSGSSARNDAPAVRRSISLAENRMFTNGWTATAAACSAAAGRARGSKA